MKRTTKIAIAGGGGKMGKQLIHTSAAMDGIKLGAVFVRADSPLLHCDAGEVIGAEKRGVQISRIDIQKKDRFDVLIDFTGRQGTLHYLDFCIKHKKAMVIGTTGLTPLDKEKIHIASKHIAIVMADNFSVGVNLLLTLLAQVTKVMGEQADIEIIEAHHKDKRDAPSGTALAMGNVIASALDQDLQHCAIYDRQSNMAKRNVSSIGFSSIRAGDIVGEHTALFAIEGERLEISHKAANRTVFARGALKAAIWVADKPAGLYGMKDVLHLTS